MKLPKPNYVDADLVENIDAERQNGINKDFFSGIAADWKARVAAYVEQAGNPETVPAWTAIAGHKVKFLTLYDSPGENSVQRPILAHLRERTMQLCPGCGEDGTPNTLDHYLPKTAYPHFAVMTANLVPLCDICQLKKGTTMLDQDGQRMFLHPYFDDFVTGHVVILAIEPPFDAPGFSLAPDPALDGGDADLLSRHLAGLEIEARYGHYFREQYLRLLKLTKELREKDLSVPQMIAVFQSDAARKAPNSWLHIFYAAVTANAALMNFLENEVLPGYI